ncbi:MAG: DUF1080 domain-containing protein [Gemmataceae bacterium]|nr:DUF1080 domain-containing protein [Gemmataceae bacterium]
MARRLGLALTALALVSITYHSSAQRFLNGVEWPTPPVVTPGQTDREAPSDAVVLFDGKTFDEWKGADGWKADEDGAFTVKGVLQTKQEFGDCQLHLEFASPSPAKGNGQGRGNNGVGLMGARYEIQVLDSFDNKTYPEGQAGSVYNQRPPMVNSSRKPGEWQTYDIVFTVPRFAVDGKLAKPGFVTVIHNGVVVQNHTEILGYTYFDKPTAYSKHPEKGPIVLMYHGDPVRFRNMWVREVKELVGKPGPKGVEGKK